MPDLRCAVFISLLCLIVSNPSVAAEDYGKRIDAVSANPIPPRSLDTLNPPPPLPATTHALQYGQPIGESTRHSTEQTVGGPVLRPKSSKQQEPAHANVIDRMKELVGGRSISTVMGGLAIVLGAFFLLAWAIRRGMPNAMSRLPNDVIEVLGRATLTAKQSVHLVRLGNKLLLVSATPTGAETLAEVTDPDEVTRLIGLCGQPGHGNAQTAFRKVFEELGHGRADGFLGNDSPERQNA